MGRVCPQGSIPRAVPLTVDRLSCASHAQPPTGVRRWCMSALERIVLKKSFWGDDPNFSGLLMHFARGDMGDHIVSLKNDHGASPGRYGVSQWWSRLEIS